MSSTRSAFAWVMPSISITARLIWPMPLTCDWDAWEICVMRSDTLPMLSTMPSSASPDRVTRSRAASTASPLRSTRATDVLARIHATPGELAHFGGDHGKAATALARLCSFDGRIERQQVGLEGDAVDQVDDLRDVAAGLFDGEHGVDGLAGDMATVFDVRKRIARRRGGAIGVAGALGGRIGHLRHGGGGFFQA